MQIRTELYADERINFCLSAGVLDIGHYSEARSILLVMLLPHAVAKGLEMSAVHSYSLSVAITSLWELDFYVCGSWCMKFIYWSRIFSWIFKCRGQRSLFSSPAFHFNIINNCCYRYEMLFGFSFQLFASVILLVILIQLIGW